MYLSAMAESHILSIARLLSYLFDSWSHNQYLHQKFCPWNTFVNFSYYEASLNDCLVSRELAVI